MTGFILAAGFGTRLRPLTEHIPKALIPVCGIPMLERSIDFFISQGITRLCVNAHYHAEQLSSFQKNSPVRFELFHEKGAILGTGGALWFAQEFLKNDEAFCVANVDIFSTVNLKKAAEVFMQSPSVCALIAVPTTGKGTIGFDPDTKEYCGSIAEIRTDSVYAAADFIGITFYKRRIFNFITEHDFSILPVWKRVKENGCSVTVYLEEDVFWTDIGTPAELAKLHFSVLDGKIAMKVPSAMHIDYTRKNAVPAAVYPQAISAAKEYAWIDSVAVDPSAVVDHSVVGEDAVVGSDARVSHMILTKWGGVSFA